MNRRAKKIAEVCGSCATPARAPAKALHSTTHRSWMRSNLCCNRSATATILNLRSGRDKPDWPRFLFIMVINFLTRSIFDNEKPKEPFRDLFSAYLIYMTTRELWQLPERLLPLPPEDHRARSVTKPPPPPRSSRGKSHSVAGLSPTRYHFLDSTRCI